MPKNPEEMGAAMIANMKEKTGKALPQWIKIAKARREARGAMISRLAVSTVPKPVRSTQGGYWGSLG